MICLLFGKIDIKIWIPGTTKNLCIVLKACRTSIVKEVIKESPILLLDDVLSELDRERQNYLLNSIGDIQTF